MNLNKTFEKLPKPVIISLGLLQVGLFWFLDYITGADFGFSIFYVIPISFIVWFSESRFSGIVFSVLCAAAWIIAENLTSEKDLSKLFLFWNGTVRFGFFIIISLALSKIKMNANYHNKIARTDSLTGISNVRSFSEFADICITNNHQEKIPFVAVYFDIDNFKGINDSLGHLAGDRLLQVVAEVLKKNIRSSDLSARLGGDEFGILLLNISGEDWKDIVIKLRLTLLQEVRNKGFNATFSIGAAKFISPPQNVDKLIAVVDDLMYSVKNNGKDGIKFTEFR